MRSNRKLPDGGVVAPARRRVAGAPARRWNVTTAIRTVLGRHRVGLSRRTARRVLASLLVVLVLATLAYLSTTAAVYLMLALAVLSLPVVLPYLVVRGVVAFVER